MDRNFEASFLGIANRLSQQTEYRREKSKLLWQN